MMDQRDAFLEQAKRGGIVPVVREVVTDADTPVAAFAKIARPPFAFLLESLVGGERWARYTFLGTEPREAWRYRDQKVDRWTAAAGWEPAGETADPIGHLANRMRALPSPPHPHPRPAPLSRVCHASPVAPSVISATIWSVRSSVCLPRPGTHSASRTPSS